MIGAQVAVNYGLFAHTMVFRGPYQEADRVFLAEMAENTAREIYVNKLLKPNPFLTEAGRVAFEKREQYLQADLVFDDDSPAQDSGPTRDAWTTSGRKVAVLSSGGKESLLSYGILDELGLETHALFVNESGRHWYTALNGFRHFESTVPDRTARVWTSADRVFNWMLKRLPFIRPDFQDVRSDIYPIRLWTVAVFLFGVLPVMRKRGIGRLVIGDEFDTTLKASHRGIPHFAGLYDQSRFFDNAMSLFFQRKRWFVAQFSILRPLSEFLGLKILLERYPDLQRHQVSCHAASIRDGRAFPCGKCEKCRRVVSMVVALDGDPEACGYTQDQITRCLRDLESKSVHQEAAAAKHTLSMLLEKGRISLDPKSRRAVGPHPEVMHLRFDPQRSPVHGIPRSLRRSLFSLVLEHAEGAMVRAGRQWTPFDVLDDPSFLRPYRFEGPGADSEVEAEGEGQASPRTDARDYLWGELTWPDAERRLAEVDVALLPVGSIEQHGHHLPLDTDAFDADYLCRRVAERCPVPRPLVLPPIPYGVAYHHEDFPGTLSVGPETLAKFVYEVGMSAAKHGITKLIIVNGHGGNMPTLQFAAQMINRDAHIFTFVDTGETSDADVAKLTDTKADVHAGEVETSTSLAVRRGLVNMEEAKRFVPRFSNRYLDFSSEYSVEWYAHTARISPTGVMGDPTEATVEKGTEIWEIMIGHLVSFVETLKSMTLAEIHQRRS